MTNPSDAASTATNPREKIIVALDVDSAEEARRIQSELLGQVGAFKIGMQLFTAAGPKLVREFTDAGNKIFLDLKFHDIPNTVARASVEAARLGVWMFNIHTLGGSEMIKRTITEVADVCEKETIVRPLVIGVTILTSSNDAALKEVGIGSGVEKQVVSLAKLAADCGLDGVVASSKEVGLVRNEVKKSNFLIITPGIRQTLATVDDQKRVTTFGDAVANGSDYVVIGRPIVETKDRRAAVEQIVAGLTGKE